MKSLSDLIDIYYNDLHETLQELENKRKTLLKKSFIFAIFLAILAASVIYIFKDFENSIFYISFFTLSLFFTFYRYISKEYKKEFKEKVIKKLIYSIDPNLDYKPFEKFPISLYYGSKIFPKKVDKYVGNDLVTGKIGETSLIFSDIHTQYKTKDSKGRTHWYTVFKGLFLMADFNKNFHGITIVYPDFAEKFFGPFGHFFQGIFKKQGLELIKLDYPEFEKEFVVYSDDQIEARYILTHNLMQKIVNMKKKLKLPIYLSFVNNHIFIAIGQKDFFEPTIFKSLLNFDVLKNYIISLKFTIGIVEELNLNRRIWS